MLRNVENCNADPNKLYQTKNNVHIPSGYSMQLVRSYDENLIIHYQGIDCLKKFKNFKSTSNNSYDDCKN